MTSARVIVRSALTFHLNRLSPGEAEDADLFTRCLDALNDVVDEFNGTKACLFREILTPSSSGLTGPSAELGTAWPSLVSGDRIEGATYTYQAGMEVPIDSISMGQYANIAIKTTQSLPRVFAHDGASTVYFYPACSGQVVTLRTRQAVSDFADLDTDYSMPKGYKSAFAALLAERMAPSLLGSNVPVMVARAAAAARSRLNGQTVSPAILGNGTSVPGNILTGWY